MRSKFGELAKSLRARLGLTQTEFARKLSEPVTRVSNLEYGRTNIGDEVLQKYVEVLCKTEQEEIDLRDQARYSNLKRALVHKKEPLPSIQALISMYGAKLSPKAERQIREILEKDVGEKIGTDIKVLNLQNRSSIKGAKRTKSNRKLLSPERFVEIALFADEVRKTYFKKSECVRVESLFEMVSLENPRFDFDIVIDMPSVARESYACVIGDNAGNVVYCRSALFEKAVAKNPFASFALCHEFGHVLLHGHLLKSDAKAVINLQPSVSFERDSGNFEFLGTVIEEEAEIFATFLMVPIEKLFGKLDTYLNVDYRIPDSKTKHCVMYYCKNRLILDQLKRQLFDRGDSDHPIFRVEY